MTSARRELERCSREHRAGFDDRGVTSSAGLNHRTHVTMYQQSHRVDLTNEIIQNFGSTHTWAFTFNLSQPDVHTEEVGAVLHDKLTTQGGDYSPTQARYDWASVNHFADMTSSNGNVGVTVSNADCSFVKIGIARFPAWIRLLLS